MSDKKKMATLGLFGVVLAFTLLMYFGVNTSEKDSVSICSFAFIILAEVIVFVNAFLVAGSKDAMGYTAVSSFYAVLSLIVNLLLVHVFALRGLIITNVCLLLLYAFIILIDVLSKKDN